MAGLPWYGVAGSLLSGFEQGLQNAQNQRLQQQMAQLQFQKQIQELQQQRQLQQALGAGYEALLGGDLQQNLQQPLQPGVPDFTPQTPGPGQPSTPMAQSPAQQPFPQPTSTDPSQQPIPQTPGDYTVGIGEMEPPQPVSDFHAAQLITQGTWQKPSPGDVDLSALNPALRPVMQRESAGNPNVGWTGVDLTNAPKDETGFPIWEGRPGPAGPSHAAGLLQFQPDTWRPIARKLGIHDFSSQSQIAVGNELYREQGMAPWAASAPGGQQPLAQAAQGLQIATPIARQTAVTAANNYPTQIYGGASLQQMAQAIDKANPGLPPAVKMMALMQFQKLMAPEEKMQMQMMLLQHKDEMAFALKDLTIQQQQQALSQRGWQVLTDPSTHQQYRYNAGTGEATTLDLKPYTPGGAQKLAGPGRAQPYVDPTTQTPFLMDPNNPSSARTLDGKPYQPQGMLKVSSQDTTVPESAIEMNAQGIADYSLPPLTAFAMRTPAGYKTMARVKQINPDYDATQYTGKLAGARSVGTRAKNLEMATNVADEMIPLVKATSDRINRTQYPTINALELAYQKGTGSEDVVRFLEQINSFKYIYARALNPTGVPRIEDLRRFDDIISENWSKGQINAGLDQIRQNLAAEQRGIKKTVTPGATPPSVTAPTGRPRKAQDGAIFEQQDDGSWKYVGPAGTK